MSQGLLGRFITIPCHLQRFVKVLISDYYVVMRPLEFHVLKLPFSKVLIDSYSNIDTVSGVNMTTI